MIAIDTNLPIYAHRTATPEHRAAQGVLRRAADSEDGWGIAQPSVAEFWAVVTHPASAGRPSTPGEATAFLLALRDWGAQFWVPGPGFVERLLGVADGLNVRGVRIFDLNIALTAFESGAREMWTHDRDFLLVPGLRVRFPLAGGR